MGVDVYFIEQYNEKKKFHYNMEDDYYISNYIWFICCIRIWFSGGIQLNFYINLEQLMEQKLALMLKT